MSSVGPARGLLRTELRDGVFHHERLAPPAELSRVVQHFWSVRWELRGDLPQVQETLPHPNVHLVFDPHCTRILGVLGARFTAVLRGKGCAFGVKFRAGAFRPFLGRPISTLRCRSLPASEVFGESVESLRELVLAQPEDAARARIVTDFLRARMPPEDPEVVRVSAMVEDIASDHTLTRVDAVAERWGLTPRALQRLFNDYVGVGPKWVVSRYRLHEALERVSAGPINWTDLALELGYFDQAHFIRDFKAAVGCSPAAYASGQSGS